MYKHARNGMTLSCLLAAACSSDPGPQETYLQPGFEAALTDKGGCADMQVYARSPDNDIYIKLVNFDANWVATANQTPEEKSFEVDLAQDATTEVRAVYGVSVGDELCSDFGDGFEELEVWYATSGTATIRIVPGTVGGELAEATVTLTDIELALDGNPDVTLIVPSLIIAGVTVGWLPG